MAEIAGWSALLGHMRAAYPQTAADRFLVPLPGGGREVGVAQVPAPPGRPWLALAIILGPMAPFALRGTLVANAELPAGALALAGDTIVLRQTLPLDGLDAAQLDQALGALAAVAARLQPGAAPYAYVYR